MEMYAGGFMPETLSLRISMSSSAAWIMLYKTQGMFEHLYRRVVCRTMFVILNLDFNAKSV